MLHWLLSLIVLFILLGVYPSYSLTVEEVLTLKKSGISDHTIQMLIEQEIKSLHRADRLGTYTTADGWIVHSTGSSSGCAGYSAVHAPIFVYPAVQFPVKHRR